MKGPHLVTWDTPEGAAQIARIDVLADAITRVLVASKESLTNCSTAMLHLCARACLSDKNPIEKAEQMGTVIVNVVRDVLAAKEPS